MVYLSIIRILNCQKWLMLWGQTFNFHKNNNKWAINLNPSSLPTLYEPLGYRFWSTRIQLVWRHCVPVHRTGKSSSLLFQNVKLPSSVIYVSYSPLPSECRQSVLFFSLTLAYPTTYAIPRNASFNTLRFLIWRIKTRCVLCSISFEESPGKAK